jgi:hypothetical protein
MKKEQFFIGWNGELSQHNKKILKRFLIPIFIFVPLLCFLLIYFTKPFEDTNFELGNVKEFVGTFQDSPFPVLILEPGQVADDLNHHALLVGYGKNGAETFIKEIEQSEGKLAGRKIKIQGTLIYGDGRVLIELTKKEKSLLEILNGPKQENRTSILSSQQVSFKGEIMDPKCWFGVMKPAEGKVHKSCAIRCISGGIPPVLKVKENGSNTYYILKSNNEMNINKSVLSFVAEPVSMTGAVSEHNGWKVLTIDPSTIKLE